jgi:hypothetical protein
VLPEVGGEARSTICFAEWRTVSSSLVPVDQVQLRTLGRSCHQINEEPAELMADGAGTLRVLAGLIKIEGAK